MRKLIRYFFITFFLTFCTIASAEDKIVVLDLRYVLNKSKAGAGAQSFLKKSYTENTKKYADIEKELKKEEADLLTKKTVLSKAEYQKKSDALRKKVIDYQSQRRSALDKISTQRAKSRDELIKKIDWSKDISNK